MRSIVFPFLIITAVTSVFVQAQERVAAADPSDRKSILKGMVAQDRGEITAIEPSSRVGGGVIIGYRSGAVLNCYADHRCREFGGTPATPVERLAVSRWEGSEVVWVTYRQGALYRCVENQCTKFLWDGSQR